MKRPNPLSLRQILRLKRARIYGARGQYVNWIQDHHEGNPPVLFGFITPDVDWLREEVA